MSNKELISRARGCILGAACGDALGAVVEFKRPIQIQKLFPNGVREMYSGGSHNQIAGQTTDDTDMMLALAYSLLTKGTFDPTTALKNYVQWYHTTPTDMGMNMHQTLSAVANAMSLGADDLISVAQAAANKDSQANGAMMRVSPIAVFGCNKDINTVVDWAIEDCKLTHINPICAEANAVYVVALHTALNTGDAKQAYEKAVDWAYHHNYSQPILERLGNAKHSKPDNYVRNMGWVLTAMQNAFYHLNNTTSTEEAIVQTISEGGDTDTNACIAGALMGAVNGVESLPGHWIEAVVSCEPAFNKFGVFKPRPEVFWGKNVAYLAEALLVTNGIIRENE